MIPTVPQARGCCSASLIRAAKRAVAATDGERVRAVKRSGRFGGERQVP